jgi:hypothetical protein
VDAEVRRLGRVLEADPSRENLERLDSARRRVGDGPWLPTVVPVRGPTFAEAWASLGRMVTMHSTLRYWIHRSSGLHLPGSFVQIQDPE